MFWCVSVSISILSFAFTANADTIQAANCSRSAVGTAVASALEGDVVLLPAGDCDWSANLTITKGITLRGQGAGATIIRDSVPAGSNPMAVLTLAPPANQILRVTGIEFRAGSRMTTSGVGVLNLVGVNTDRRRVRVDNCRFDTLRAYAIRVDGALGVFDHNVVLFNISAGAAYILHTNWDGASLGDGAAVAANQFGTDQFFFFEDNVITYTGTAHATGIEAEGGSRYVVRYNTITKANLGGHGTESGGRYRSTRAVEIYNNVWIGSDGGGAITYFRGGVGLVHDNAIYGFQGAKTPMLLLNNRNTGSFTVWGGADGTNPWDVNVPGGPFARGTVVSASPLTVTVAGTPWSANQWSGYSIKRTTNVGNLVGNNFSEIASNSSNKITFAAASQNGNLQFSVGDSFEIWKVSQAFDQPGRWGGALLSAVVPSPPPTNTQATSPWYQWNNLICPTSPPTVGCSNGVGVDFQAVHKTIRAGEHYVNGTQAPSYTPYTYPHPVVRIPSAPANPHLVR